MTDSQIDHRKTFLTYVAAMYRYEGSVHADADTKWAKNFSPADAAFVQDVVNAIRVDDIEDPKILIARFEGKHEGANASKIIPQFMAEVINQEGVAQVEVRDSDGLSSAELSYLLDLEARLEAESRAGLEAPSKL